jgi:hypothetical protein
MMLSSQTKCDTGYAPNCINHRHLRAGGLYAWEFEMDGQDFRLARAGPYTAFLPHAQWVADARPFSPKLVPPISTDGQSPARTAFDATTVHDPAAARSDVLEGRNDRTGTA